MFDLLSLLFLCFCVPPPPLGTKYKLTLIFDSFHIFFCLFLFLLSYFLSLCVDSVLVSLFFFCLLRVVQCLLFTAGVPRFENAL